MKRILEPEGMGGMDRVLAYERISSHALGGWMAAAEVKGAVDHVVSKLRPGSKILDLGCGPGSVTLGVAGECPGYEIYGVDISPEALTIARRNMDNEKAANVTFAEGDAKRLDFGDGFFDGAYCLNMLHHLENPVTALRELKRVVKGGGIVSAADLIRPPFELAARALAVVFGLFYDDLMRMEYLDSLRAAFTFKEYKGMMVDAGYDDFRLCYKFPHHAVITVRLRN